MTTTHETRALFPNVKAGGRYSTLLHTVRVEDGRDAAVLCSRVSLENIDEAAAMEGATGTAPTCPDCLRRDPRFALTPEQK